MLGQAWRVLTPACVVLALIRTNVGAGLEGTYFSLCGVGSERDKCWGRLVGYLLQPVWCWL